MKVQCDSSQDCHHKAHDGLTGSTPKKTQTSIKPSWIATMSKTSKQRSRDLPGPRRIAAIQCAYSCVKG